MPANKILPLYETYIPLTIFQPYGTMSNSDYVTFDSQNMREYKRFNDLAVFGPIYTHLFIVVPYHDCCQKQTQGENIHCSQC